MSDWARVMIVWTGIDGGIENNEHHTRLRRIISKAKEQPYFCPVHVESVVYPCGHDASQGMCCEFVAVCSSNHFYGDLLLPVLRLFEWEYPEQVGVMWKSEQEDHYSCVYLEEGDESQAQQ